MSNYESIIQNSFLVIKKTLITILASITLTGTTTTPTNISNGTISKDSLKKYEKESQQIVNTINVEKVNLLNLVAPEYKKIVFNQAGSTPSNNLSDKKPEIEGENGNKTNKTIGKKTSPIENTESNKSLDININNTSIENSVVNIRCESKIGNKIKINTGSGIIISKDGLILTAAHVAAPVYAEQQGKNYSCFLKIKDPAEGEYPLRVVFIHPKWINEHFNEFEQKYTETGEFDIALIKINQGEIISGTNSEQKINKINSLSRAILNNKASSVLATESIKIIAYPADTYGKYGVFSVLSRKTEQNSIDSLIAMGNHSVHPIFETQTSNLGQSGASGGGIFNTNDKLIGLISNVISSTNQKNKIRAIDINHVQNEILNNTNKNILEF